MKNYLQKVFFVLRRELDYVIKISWVFNKVEMKLCWMRSEINEMKCLSFLLSISSEAVRKIYRDFLIKTNYMLFTSIEFSVSKRLQHITYYDITQQLHSVFTS